MEERVMAVVSEPANAIEIAIVVTRVSVTKYC